MISSPSRKDVDLSVLRCLRAVRWLGLGLVLAPLVAAAQGVPDMVRLGVASDPAVQVARANLRAAQQRVVQARAGFGPTVNLTGNLTETRYREQPELNLRAFQAKQAALQLTQPLLRATLLPALDSARAQVLQAESAVVQAQLEAALRVVDTSVDVLKSRETLALALAQRAEAVQQVATARGAFRIGTVPVTDVREAEAQVDRMAAEVVGAQADFALQQQLLAELVGEAVADLAQRGLQGGQPPALGPDSLPLWLAEARLQNPQIIQAQHAVAAAQADVRKAELGHAPTVDLSLSYNKTSDSGTFTSSFPRSGDSTAVGVNVTIPLFASGATQSKLREAVALSDKARAELDAAVRKVVLAVRQGHAVTLTALARALGLEAAVRSQEVALRAQRRGQEVGMKSAVDVFQSQSRLFAARRELAHARLDAWAGHLRLSGMAGRLSTAELQGFDAALALLPAPELLQPRTPAQPLAPAPGRP